MSVNFFWFRRDLRLEDNAGLFHALSAGLPVIPVFIFDRHILDKLEDKSDARVTFIHDTLEKLKAQLQTGGSDLLVYYGTPEEVWKSILSEWDVDHVFANHDDESYARQRDSLAETMLKDKNVGFKTFKDHLIFERSEVVKDDGLPYTVFTPYKRKWLQKIGEDYTSSPYLRPFPSESLVKNFKSFTDKTEMPGLKSMGFARSSVEIPSIQVAREIIRQYDKNRDIPSLDATSKLGVHFRFGTISIRDKASKAFALNATYLSELIWRDFYAMILYHFPHVEKGAFRPVYDQIEWRNNEQEFKAWCEGKTGYPIVDAGMRQLLATGYMHNRVRMIVASFLTKHLLIDWRWGEAWFAAKLLDFDLASNNGGWQWAAGSGTDAAPYFRIFNPEAQTEKFDPDKKYIRKWVPEFGTPAYPKPLVDHKMARERCLSTYKKALTQG
jgi:deoxyribodipyrimidine photo-lyase